MKIYDKFTVRIPEYALSYLINADDSGLPLEDKAAIDKWFAYYEGWAAAHHGVININILSEEGYFTWTPSFGLACSVVDAELIVLVVSED